MSGRAASLAARLLEAERDLCRRATRVQRRPLGLALFRAVSWLGNGPFWFGLAALLPAIGGATALPTVARMAAVGVVSTLVVKGLKSWTVRPRPFAAVHGIAAASAPLDPWSFPSGHTLHAVAFTVVLVADRPALALPLLPFTFLVAASRVVLGLHYPSDVAAGAALGGLLAAAALALS